MLKKLIENFEEFTYDRVKRSEETHAESLVIAKSELERLVKLNKKTKTPQTARLIRDSMDHWIRRYHGYVIQGGIGAHYIQQDVDLNNCIFEHVIPAARVRDMFIQGILTADQALNTPTCFISKENDKILRKNGLVSSSPDFWLFFERYDVFDDTQFFTYTGQLVPVKTWTLEDHFNFVLG